MPSTHNNSRWPHWYTYISQVQHWRLPHSVQTHPMPRSSPHSVRANRTCHEFPNPPPRPAIPPIRAPSRGPQGGDCGCDLRSYRSPKAGKNSSPRHRRTVRRHPQTDSSSSNPALAPATEGRGHPPQSAATTSRNRSRRSSRSDSPPAVRPPRSAKTPAQKRGAATSHCVHTDTRTSVGYSRHRVASHRGIDQSFDRPSATAPLLPSPPRRFAFAFAPAAHSPSS